MTQRGPGEVLKSLGQFGIGDTAADVFNDGGSGEQFQCGFPEIKGGEVAFERGLGVMGAAIQLRQRQRQTGKQSLVSGGVLDHGTARVHRGRMSAPRYRGKGLHRFRQFSRVFGHARIIRDARGLLPADGMLLHSLNRLSGDPEKTTDVNRLTFSDFDREGDKRFFNSIPTASTG